MNNKLTDYEYSILDEIRRDEINQALRLKDLIVKRIKQIEDEYPIKGEEDWQPRKTHSEYILLQSLLDDSTKNEET